MQHSTRLEPDRTQVVEGLNSPERNSDRSEPRFEMLKKEPEGHAPRQQIAASGKSKSPVRSLGFKTEVWQVANTIPLSGPARDSAKKDLPHQPEEARMNSDSDRDDRENSPGALALAASCQASNPEAVNNVPSPDQERIFPQGLGNEALPARTDETGPRSQGQAQSEETYHLPVLTMGPLFVAFDSSDDTANKPSLTTEERSRPAEKRVFLPTGGRHAPWLPQGDSASSTPRKSLDGKQPSRGSRRNSEAKDNKGADGTTQSPRIPDISRSTGSSTSKVEGGIDPETALDWPGAVDLEGLIRQRSIVGIDQEAKMDEVSSPLAHLLSNSRVSQQVWANANQAKVLITAADGQRHEIDLSADSVALC